MPPGYYYSCMSKKVINLLIYIVVLITACTSKQSENMENTNSDENLLREEVADHKIVIYQLFTRLFGNKKTTNKEYGTIQENGSINRQ